MKSTCIFMYFYVIPAVRSAGLQGVELILGAKLGSLGSKRAAGRYRAAAVGSAFRDSRDSSFPLIRSAEASGNPFSFLVLRVSLFFLNFWDLEIEPSECNRLCNILLKKLLKQPHISIGFPLPFAADYGSIYI